MAGKVFVTGSGGFIGFHLSRLLLAEGFRVHGFDGMTGHCGTALGLKKRRHEMLQENPRFSATEAMLEEERALMRAGEDFAPDCIVHLAAQAGVRHSLENPRIYASSNLAGTFNVMELTRQVMPAHFLLASTSSVYGGNGKIPFRETDQADNPLTLYAATKKACESMAHAYAHLWNIPTSAFRFFTVYGPWGRPDMALFRFVEAAIEGRPVALNNRGAIYRDFTYIDDLVRGIRLLMDAIPERPTRPSDIAEGDSLSPVAPFRIVNIGSGRKATLSDVIKAIESCLGCPIARNPCPMQKGDMPATWADTALLARLTGFRPQVPLKTGIARFVAWYRDYYRK